MGLFDRLSNRSYNADKHIRPQSRRLENDDEGDILQYSAYLFDFDYTLADSERAILFCYRFVLGAHGYEGITDDAIRRTIGLTLPESFRLLTGKEDEATLGLYRREYVKKADEVMVQETVLYETVLPMIRRLKEKNCRIAIVSTKYRYRIMGTLQRYGITDLIDLVVGGEDVARMKPNPAGVLKALDLFHAEKRDALFVGDSLVDANTAKNAGVDFAAVTTGVTAERDFADLPAVKIMRDLSELPIGRDEK